MEDFGPGETQLASHLRVCALPMYGQTANTGAITGRVRDFSGAPVAIQGLHPALKALGLEKTGSHAFRRGCNRRWELAGVNPAVIRQQMGHASAAMRRGTGWRFHSSKFAANFPRNSVSNPSYWKKPEKWKMKRQRKSFGFRMMERKSYPHPKLEEFLTLAAGAIYSQVGGRHRPPDPGSLCTQLQACGGPHPMGLAQVSFISTLSYVNFPKELATSSVGEPMPTELIGEFGTPGATSEWIEGEGKLAIRHLKKICGDSPPEMELEIQWQEHELGSYPTIALVWDDPMRGAPSNYLSRCEAALTAYENGGELPPGWTMPPVRSGDDDPNEPFDPDEPPPEPPETLNVLEHQRYISKLIHWGLEASRLERSRPHLVEKDDDREDVP